MLPCIAWGVGAMRRAALSPHMRPSTAIASTDTRSIATQNPARTPDAVAVAPVAAPTALAETNSGAQITPQPQAPVKARRAGRHRRLVRHSRRSKQRHLT